MKAPLLLLTTVASLGATTDTSAPAVVAPPAPQSAAPAPLRRFEAAPAVRLPGFAAALAQAPTISTPAAWESIPDEVIWPALATATPDRRQWVRWDYARSLIAANRAPEALGVLEVMRQDDPDLALVDSYQLALGAVLTQMHRPDEALRALSGPRLATLPEACAWRLRSLVEVERPEQALQQLYCALPAINARSGQAGTPFLAAAASAAIDTGQPELALQWLQMAPDRDPTANLYRGKAYLALGQEQPGRFRLARAEHAGNAVLQMDAKLSAIEVASARGTLPPREALQQLDRLRFVWRGDAIEKRALRLTYRLATDMHDLRRSLGAGATLFRYFPLGTEAGPLLTELQASLRTALAPDSPLTLQQAAGLYWDYRDLSPAGAEGDFLVSQLADRLQAAGLYARAAELLEHQLTARAKDIAQGPLSVRVATLHILSGQPKRALMAIRDTEGPLYPEEMLWDRHRVEAVALHHLGNSAEALAVLQDLPDGNLIRSEIYWKTQNWSALAAMGEPALPAPGTMSDVAQATVLRHAIALAMLGREDAIAALRARYGRSFAALPSGSTFDMLTRRADTIDPMMIGKAMSMIPSASPAGKVADLLSVRAMPAPPAGP